MRKRVACLIAVVSLTAGAAAGGTRRMVFPGKAWQEATPGSQGVDSAKLNDAIAYLEKSAGRDGVEQLVIIRNGRLIWRGSHIDKVHGVWSLTKSFTSTVLGLLIDDGKARLDTVAKGHVAALAAGYPAVTLRHFATMTSGYRAVGDEPRGGYTHGPSKTPFLPSPEPLFAPPGSQYAYWDSAMNEFAHVLTRIAGEPLKALFRRRLADPLGMDLRQWDWGDFGKVDGIVVNGGSGNHNRHVRISAREVARFGLLFLNRGKWRDKQLLSVAWVDAATSVHVPASMPWAHPDSEIDGRGVYGYNWWVNGARPDGTPKWPGAPPCTYAASGYNNNDLFVIPEWNMVLVRLGLDERDVKISDEVYGTFLRKVGEAIASSKPPHGRPPARGPLRVHPRNPRYFTDGSGKAVFLAGSHMGWELQDHAWGREHVFDFDGFLDSLAKRNHNLMRMWMVEHTRCDKGNPKAIATPMPWRRTGPGQALDGRPKFDLAQFDPAYFERLRSRAKAAGDRGVYVVVMLFQGFSVHKYRGRNPWLGHPLNKRNNTQGIDGDLNADGDGREIHTLANPKITALQEAYVRKVIDTVGDLDNVLYEIANEAGGYSTAWQHHLIRFVQRYEATRAKQHPVGMTVQIRKGSNQVLLDSPADWISPNREGGYDRDPPPADGRKVILSDTDHHGAKPYPERRAWVWKSVLRGHNVLFLDMYPEQETRQLDRIADARLDPQWEPIRRGMGLARALAERIDLAAMTPRGDLASSPYCLANPGAAYLVYLPQGGRVEVDLSAAKDTLAVEWIDPRTGKATRAEAVRGGGRAAFTAPFGGDALLYLVRTGGGE